MGRIAVIVGVFGQSGAVLVSGVDVLVDVVAAGVIHLV